MCSHIPHRELTRATLDIFGLRRIPCRSVGCRHCVIGGFFDERWMKLGTWNWNLKDSIFQVTFPPRDLNTNKTVDLAAKQLVFNMQEKLNTFYKTTCRSPNLFRSVNEPKQAMGNNDIRCHTKR